MPKDALLLTEEEIIEALNLVLKGGTIISLKPHYLRELEAIAKAQLKRLVEWGDTYCLQGKEHGRASSYANVRKRECRYCWQQLLKELPQ